MIFTELPYFKHRELIKLIIFLFHKLFSVSLYPPITLIIIKKNKKDFTSDVNIFAISELLFLLLLDIKFSIKIESSIKSSALSAPLDDFKEFSLVE